MTKEQLLAIIAAIIYRNDFTVQTSVDIAMQLLAEVEKRTSGASA